MRYWYKVHRWISLICVIFFLMLCITGLPLLFKMEIHDYNLLHAQMSHAAVKYDSIWNYAAEGEKIIMDKYPDKNIKAVSVQPDEGRLLYRVQDKDSKKIVDARLSMGGEQIAFYPGGHALQNWHREAVKSPFIAQFMHVMHVLHMYMGLGKGGMIFLGIMCFLSFVSVVSGMVIYGPFMKRMRFAQVSGMSAAAKWFGWHKFLGIVTAAWAALLCFSGVMIVVFSLGYGSYINTAKSEAAETMPPDAGAENIGLPQAIDFVNQHFAKDYILSIDMPDKRLNHSRYVFYLTPAKENPTDFMGQLVFVGADAQGNMQCFTKPLPAYLSFAAASLDLHVHNHESMGLKIIWAVLDIATIIVIISGFAGWWKRSSKMINMNGVKADLAAAPLSQQKIWRMPIIVFILSTAGMVLPLSDKNGGAGGIIAWAAVLIICVCQWRRQK